MPDVQHKRGSRADLNTLASANGLLLGQIYLITDEDRLAVATGVGSYQAAEKEGGGGGGTALELYAENPSSPTAPSATGANAVAIGSGSTSSHETTFSVMGATASGQYSMAFNKYAVSSGFKSIALGWLTDATNTSSVAIGTGTQSSGLHSVALGQAYASGTDSFAAAISTSASTYGATGANSIAMGRNAKASASASICLSGINNIASGTYSFVAGGGYNTSSGTYAFSSGQSSIAAGAYSTVIGRGSKTTANATYAVASGYQSFASIVGQKVHSAGRFSSDGDAQTGTFVLRSDTTDATPEALTTDNSAAGTTDQIILPNNSAFAFHGTIVARQQASGGTACAAWKVEGLIRREGSAGATVLVNSATTILDNTPAWGMALSADTTNGGLKIEVTGAASTNIRWVATINTSEVTY